MELKVKELQSDIARAVKTPVNSCHETFRLLLIKFEVSTVKYGPSFFSADLRSKRELGGPWEEEKNKPNKAETAFHGCHRSGDIYMAVRVREVLVRTWVGIWVCHLLLV